MDTLSTNDLGDMDTAQAREYVAAHISSLKLNQKKLFELKEEIKKWTERQRLAQAAADNELSAAAEIKLNNLHESHAALEAETAELHTLTEKLKKQLSTAGIRLRSVDPDLLLQELIIASGGMPGSEDELAAKQEQEKAFSQHEADARLAELKQKMGLKD